MFRIYPIIISWWLVCFFFVAFSNVSFSQSPWTVVLDGKVTKDGDKLAGALIKLMKGDEAIHQVYSAENGKFTFVLESDNDYTIVVSKKNHVTKKLGFSTKNVPSNKINSVYSKYPIDVSLFEEIEGLDVSILANPVTIIRYDSKVKNFDYDKSYLATIQTQLDRLTADLDRAKKRKEEANVLANELALEGEKEAQYKKLVEDGGLAFQRRDYQISKKKFEEALVIKPNESFPKIKIGEIEKLIENSSQKADNVRKEFDAMIYSADKSFDENNLYAAKNSYRNALRLLPDEKYPKDKLTTIEQLEKEQAELRKQTATKSAVDVKYEIIIKRADNELNGEDYTRARASYLLASQVKPSESYPNDKIKEIDQILDDLKNQNHTKNVYEPPLEKAPITRQRPVKEDTKPKKDEKSYQEYLNGLVNKYPEGVTEEIIVDGNKKITRRIVVRNGQATEYNKIIYSWATYYKKNEIDITKDIFDAETK